MKNKKGFTLIELLAVIVVLAIIALIATPIVMNTIKNAKKGSAERGTDNYIKQVETAIATSKLDGNDVPDGTYAIEENGNLTGAGLPNGKLIIEMNGEKPNGGAVVIKNGQVDTSSTMTIGDYTISYNPTNKKYEATEPIVVYRWSTDNIKIGDTINPNDTAKFTKDPATLGKDYYLKHVLDKDNKVIESYACAILNSKEYCLRGGNEDYYVGNMSILKGIETEGIACTFNESGSQCNTDHINLSASSNGSVSSHYDTDACYILFDDYSKVYTSGC